MGPSGPVRRARRNISDACSPGKPRPRVRNRRAHGVWVRRLRGLPGADARRGRDVLLPLSALSAKDADPQLFQRIGIVAPWTEPIIGDVLPQSPASRAGLQDGDRVLRVGAIQVVDGQIQT